MKTKTALPRAEWGNLILGLSLFFGLIVRLFPVTMAGFPLNDGGMFLTMIGDLTDNGFRLPAFTGYNQSSIPFAYPPLGFYVAGVLGLIGIPDLAILRWLPPVVNLLSVGGFYLLAAALLNDRPRAAVAALFFALTPGSYEWQIMGGGLTRSFGMAFLGLSILSVHRLFVQGGWKLAGLAILFCSLAVLSHPEVSLATATSCALVWLFLGRSWRGATQAALVAAGTLLVTSLWWGTVLLEHGPAPFLSVIHSGAYVNPPWEGLYATYLAPASLFTLVGLLRMAGLIWSVWTRRYFLIAWLVLPYFAEPRSAPAMAFLPACMFAALGLVDALPYLADKVRSLRGAAAANVDFTQRQWVSLGVLGVMFWLFIGSALYGFRLVNTSLVPPGPQLAMQWARDNTAPDSRFLILSGESGIMTDPVQEWFPALAGRRSQTTLQGLEWTLGEEFFPRLVSLVALQRCESVDCVEDWAEANRLDYTHVVIPASDPAQTFLEIFQADETYRPVFENPDVLIFEKGPG